jgi:hypothetical protein
LKTRWPKAAFLSSSTSRPTRSSSYSTYGSAMALQCGWSGRELESVVGCCRKRTYTA